ncbi:MAG: tetratricopeptide repeat protein [Bacteroidetes bacterium]|nr:tetratricopeptide repeat protein [Bacteroidota bacterium]
MNFTGKNIKPAYLVLFGLLVTFLAYLPALQNGFTNWDDNLYITENPLIRSLNWQNIVQWFTQPFQGLYQPLVLMSLALDFSINGLNPFWFHFTNLMLHLANTVLVFYFIRRLIHSDWMAFIVMLLFGLHPLHVESVAWVTERKDVLYSFFFLLSINFYIQYCYRQKLPYYWLTAIFFILSLLAKAAAVTLPLVLVLIDFYTGRKTFSRKVIVEKLPFFLLALGFGILVLVPNYISGTLDNYSNLSFPNRFLLASKGLMYYLEKTFWPGSLSVYNPLPMTLSTGLIVECLLYYLLFLIIALAIYRMKQREITFGALFFLLTIGLFLVPPGEPVIASERYSYISSIGLFIIIAQLFTYLTVQIDKMEIKIGATIILIGWIGFLGVTTYHHTKVWKNSFTLWDHVIQVRGESFLALLQRGNALRENRDYEEALADYSASIAMNPNYYKTYDRRGFVYLINGNYSTAIIDFNKSLTINPEGFYAQLGLGFAYRHINQPEIALDHLDKAEQLEPQNPEVYYNRGKVFLQMDRADKACKDFKKSLELGLKKQNRTEVVDLLNTLCQ